MRDWNELSFVFLHQYQAKTGIVLLNEDLVRIKRIPMEDFRAYAERWEAFVMQANPQLAKEKIMKLFIKALPRKHHSWLHGMRFCNFNEMVLSCKYFESTKAEELKGT